jgi:YD repeat-containing protein
MTILQKRYRLLLSLALVVSGGSTCAAGNDTASARSRGELRAAAGYLQSLGAMMVRRVRVWLRFLFLASFVLTAGFSAAQSITVLEAEPVATSWCGGDAYLCAQTGGYPVGSGWAVSPQEAAAKWIAWYNTQIRDATATLTGVFSDVVTLATVDPNYGHRTRPWYWFRFHVAANDGSWSRHGDGQFYTLSTCAIGWYVDTLQGYATSGVNRNSAGAEYVFYTSLTRPCMLSADRITEIKACCDATNWFGNPIHAKWGTKRVEEIDYRGFGSNSLTLSRYYRSHGNVLSTFASNLSGFGLYWTHTYSARVFGIGSDPSSATHTVGVLRGSGAVLFFTRTGATSDTYEGDLDIPDSLVSLRDASGAITGWRLYTATNTVETYDAAGRLTGTYTARGSGQSIAYDASGRMSAVADAFGHRLTFTYNASNEIESVLLPGGQVVQYTYSPLLNLIGVTYPSVASRSYIYDSSAGNQYLTGILDENASRYATYAYDSVGHAISSYHGDGVGAVKISYAQSGGHAITGPTGSTTVVGFTDVANSNRLASNTVPCGACGSQSAASLKAISYDVNGNFSSTVDFNDNRICYSHDLVRNVETARVEGLANTASCPSLVAANAALPADSRKTTVAWHPDWRLQTGIAEPNRITILVYNGQADPFNGNAIASCAPTTTPLPDGKPIAVVCKRVQQATTDGNGSQGFAATLDSSVPMRAWAYTYDSFGQVLTARDPNNNTTTNVYYSATDPDVSKRGNLQSVTNAVGHVTQFTAYDGNGRPLSITDPNGTVTTLTYHPRGWLTSRAVGGEWTTYDYDGVGQVTKVTQPDGSHVQYTYDAAHRLTQLQDGLGNKIVYTLDAMGNRIKEEAKDPSGTLARVKHQVVDSLNRLHQSIGAQ